MPRPSNAVFKQILFDCPIDSDVLAWAVTRGKNIHFNYLGWSARELG